MIFYSILSRGGSDRSHRSIFPTVYSLTPPMSIRASELHFFQGGSWRSSGPSGCEISHPRSIEFPLRCTKCTTGQSTNSNPYTVHCPRETTIRQTEQQCRRVQSVLSSVVFCCVHVSTLALDVHERCRRAAVTDVLAVEVVVRVPVHVLLVAAAHQMAARHYALLHAPLAATFNTATRQTLVHLLRHYSRRHLLEGYCTLTRCRPSPHTLSMCTTVTLPLISANVVPILTQARSGVHM